MSAATARHALAAIGQNLLAASGSSGDLRASALTGGDLAQDAPTLQDIADAPSWLLRSAEDRGVLARRAALLSIAPALATSIDGAWLGQVAETCGEAELDLVIASASNTDTDELPTCPADALEARGVALMRRALPQRLRRFLPDDGSTAPLSDGHSSVLVDRALELGR